MKKVETRASFPSLFLFLISEEERQREILWKRGFTSAPPSSLYINGCGPCSRFEKLVGRGETTETVEGVNRGQQEGGVQGGNGSRCGIHRHG